MYNTLDHSYPTGEVSTILALKQGLKEALKTRYFQPDYVFPVQPGIFRAVPVAKLRFNREFSRRVRLKSSGFPGSTENFPGGSG